MAQPLPERRLSLSEQISEQVDRLCSLAVVAADERRPHQRTEQLLDGLDEVGRACRRLGRG
ncbi:hypothetical protein [Sphingomonas solaris]|uniref:Uncharacterized protein n=1 Tax=Alterirhizorhabdus solaris TaxID=2529389 RepID=A0A558R859_9SPHN|nr:hypothetical protein [Sphingomonas solaris]TVV75557.1 hypothetical protein FOY91_06770 [Sphingomonas solaris]